MGWLYIRGASKSDVIDDLIAPEENEWRRRETIAHCVRGNVLWSVVELTPKQGEGPPRRFIACCLLHRSSDGWGYKDMQESMHPYYYSCPLRYLKMTPVANEEWRAGVREYHAKRNRKFHKGQKVAIINGSNINVPWVVIRSLRPFLGEHGGQTYRLHRRVLGDVIA